MVMDFMAKHDAVSEDPIVPRRRRSLDPVSSRKTRALDANGRNKSFVVPTIVGGFDATPNQICWQVGVFAVVLCRLLPSLGNKPLMFAKCDWSET